MLFRLSLAVVFASLFAGDVLATPHMSRQCSNLCCSKVGDANDPTIAPLLSLLGVVATGPVGVNCSPLGNSCSGQAVCCANNNFGGMIALGC
ncbi:Hydrophobin [Mycena venus]|uniref:Hydrophobin n=1 Tax=Mycena venus TaxID=2733690 RepID=A0A8H6XYF7_9AGAR|nr:Hydrophobin [Mycena venus]